jgi:putative NADH-flavin reductase
MRIAVIGATGRTGRQVVAQALARGHTVTAVTRHPESITVTDPCLVTSATDAWTTPH